MPFFLIKGDITTLSTDAIVNAANTELKMGGGVCGSIFKAAGREQMENACSALGPIKTGAAVITPAFNLKARYVIHTAGPVYRDGKSGEEAELQSCYTNSLALAKQHRCRSVAFPLISSGIYGYPKEKAVKVATDAIRSFLKDSDIQVSLVLFDQTQIHTPLLSEVQKYLDAAYDPSQARSLLDEELQALHHVFEPVTGAPMQDGLQAMLQNLDEPFSDTLLRMIREQGKSEVEVYKRANLDRKHFSKIRSGNGYLPSKKTILALTLALELDIQDTAWLLERAGYALSPASKFDVIVEYFIKEQIYDIFAINEVLFSYDQPLLGS